MSDMTNTEVPTDAAGAMLPTFTISPPLEELEALKDRLHATWDRTRDDGVGNLSHVVTDLVEYGQMMLNAHHNAMIHLTTLVEGLADLAEDGKLTELRCEQPEHGEHEHEHEASDADAEGVTEYGLPSASPTKYSSVQISSTSRSRSGTVVKSSRPQPPPSVPTISNNGAPRPARDCERSRAAFAPIPATT